MSDLRGFTSISESLKAEHVVSIINNYLAVMTEIILKYQGTIDEFIGDAILVIFGAPIQRDDDAERAVACALEMQLATEKVNRANREAGFPDVAQGIGINTGDAVVGNIGSEKRSKYGVVGRNINLTSRIESYTVGGQTLISQSTKDACGELLRIDDTLEIMPKGIADPITVYEVGGIGGNFNLYLSEKQTVDLPELVPPIAIRFSLVEGKYASRNVHEGHVIRLNPVMAEVKSEARADRLANLRIILNDVDDEEITRNLYAKVIQTFPDQPSVFRIQFTSLPPEARTYLEWIMEEKV